MTFFWKFFGVTWLERPKSVKDEVKETRLAQSWSGSVVGGVRGRGSGDPGGLAVGAQWAPRLLVYHILDFWSKIRFRIHIIIIQGQMQTFEIKYLFF